MRASLAIVLLAATVHAGAFEEAQAARREGRLEDAAGLFEKAAEGTADARAATCLNKAGVCYYLLGRADHARDRFERALVLRKRVHGGDHADVAESIGNVGAALVALDRPADALPHMREALAMRRRIGPAGDPSIVLGLDNYANCLFSLGRAEDAHRHYRDALTLAQRLEDEGLVARVRRHIGNCLVTLGRAAEALPLFEQALAASERLGLDPADDLNDLANCLDALGRPADALVLHQRALHHARKRHGKAHPAIATSLHNLGACLDSLGRPQEALPHYEQALAMRRTIFAGDHRDVFASLNNLADCLMKLERTNDAHPHCEAALAMAQRLFDGDHAYRAGARSNLATCLEALGRPGDALPHHRAALAMAERLSDGDHPDSARSLNNVAMCLVALGKKDDALPLLRRGLAMARQLDAPGEHIVLASNLGRLLAQDDTAAEAVPVLGEAIAQIEALRHDARGLEERDRATFFRHLKRFGAYEEMIRAQLALGRADEALRYLERGRARKIADLLARSRFDPLGEAERRARERKDTALLARIKEVRARLTSHEQDIARARAALPRAKKRKEIRQHRGELAAARQRQQAALRDRAQLVRDLVPAMEAATPEALQRLVGRDERMLVYSLTEQSGLLLVVPPV
ncbi:MAG: tetratricopeptide repeat protein, partial [Planctomycetota bacterium]|nr:tetratricopeptide repeat protein [Planctomycetota bacterium]